MSIFNWLGQIFAPASDLVDELHFSGEEKGKHEVKISELKNELAQIEAKVATKTLELQSQLIDANSKVAIAEQKHGNVLSKSWRPLCSLGSFIMLMFMGFDIIPFNNFLAMIFGSFLGIYTGARSWEKKK